MGNFTFDMLINSTVFAYITIRWCEILSSKKILLVAFALVIYVFNAVMLSSRFSVDAAQYKAFMISMGHVVGVFVMAYFTRREKRRKAKTKS